MSVTISDFEEFVRQVHGRDRGPFPWQRALVERVAAEGEWPAAIDVPTGLGKTSVIDAAVFLAAAKPEVARRRTIFVVDRRVVVDEAFEHARRLAQALERARDDTVAGAVADALRQPGDEPRDEDTGLPIPLDVVRMRGGVTWSSLWLERPDRHAVVVGTVDQMGSRLLFRGYGVAQHRRAIDAALVGSDSLVVVDEAHLADALRLTLKRAHDIDGRPGHRPLHMVTMTATPKSGDQKTHRATSADEAHPVAGRRLNAPKSMRLVEISATGKTAARKVADALAAEARKVAEFPDVRVVGVVANTVARARAAFEALRSVEGADAVLLTGRNRALARERLIEEWLPRIRAGRERSPGPPLFVVATQTVEVGANLDFDALVTETASLPAIVQRLGRLNRLGDVQSAPAPAVVVHDGSVGNDDPVYGSARVATWIWLGGLVAGEALDVSPKKLRDLVSTLDAPDADALRGPSPAVPMLFASTLDSWTWTSPAPVPDTPVAPFLHGFADADNTVRLVWRADVSIDSLEASRDSLAALPPMDAEIMEVPLRAFRRWLAQAPEVEEVFDVQPAVRTEEAAEQGPVERKVLRWDARRDERVRIELVAAPTIQPNDLLVVPAGYGGCDDYGWHPSSKAPVTDVSSLAALADRRTPTLRLDNGAVALLTNWYPRMASGLEELAGHLTQVSAS